MSQKWKIKLGSTARDTLVTFNGESIGLLRKTSIETGDGHNIHILKLEVFLTDFEIEGVAATLPIKIDDSPQEPNNEQKE